MQYSKHSFASQPRKVHLKAGRNFSVLMWAATSSRMIHMPTKYDRLEIEMLLNPVSPYPFPACFKIYKSNSSVVSNFLKVSLFGADPPRAAPQQTWMKQMVPIPVLWIVLLFVFTVGLHHFYREDPIHQEMITCF